MVVYVHGYRDDVDSAFVNHQLAAQFAKSKVDAMFIAVAAPSGPGQPVVFADLDALLSEVGVAEEVPVLVVGHSGGNRTLKAWLSSARVEEVVLLDGFYGESSSWTKWLTARPNARLRAVGQHTWNQAEGWRLGLPVEVRGQVTHERAGCPHMEIVTKGEWIPRVIRESRLSPSPPSGGEGERVISLSARRSARAGSWAPPGPPRLRALRRCRDTPPALLRSTRASVHRTPPASCSA